MELLAELQAAVAAIDVFPPGLGDEPQRVSGRGLLEVVTVVAHTGAWIVHARLHIVWQFGFGNDRSVFMDHPMTDSGVDVAVGVIAQQPPKGAVNVECYRALLLGSVKDEWDDGILADVLGDVFLGVVRPHLLLVDVFLKDVAHHIWVDLVVGPQGALVKMPGVLVEEVEELLERLVRDIDLRVTLFKVVDFKETAVKEGDLPE